MIESMWHTCITTPDLDRSIAFYCDVLGMKLIKGPYDRNTDALQGLRILDAVNGTGPAIGAIKLRAAFVGPNEESTDVAMRGQAQTFLDIVQYVDPPVTGEPYKSLFNVGLTRIAFRVSDIRAMHARVKEKGVAQVADLADLTEMGDPGADQLGYFCLVDPDGIVAEFVGPMTTS
jgi:catechol 2,3-dioxygenase-like lactoylglutathione lyase family enzyme